MVPSAGNNIVGVWVLGIQRQSIACMERMPANMLIAAFVSKPRCRRHLIMLRSPVQLVLRIQCMTHALSKHTNVGWRSGSNVGLSIERTRALAAILNL